MSARLRSPWGDSFLLENSSSFFLLYLEFENHVWRSSLLNATSSEKEKGTANRLQVNCSFRAISRASKELKWFCKNASKDSWSLYFFSCCSYVFKPWKSQCHKVITVPITSQMDERDSSDSRKESPNLNSLKELANVAFTTTSPPLSPFLFLPLFFRFYPYYTDT